MDIIYLDGVSFFHDVNQSQHLNALKTRKQMKKGEAKSPNCTAKAKRKEINGRTAKFMFSMDYG